MRKFIFAMAIALAPLPAAADLNGTGFAYNESKDELDGTISKSVDSVMTLDQSGGAVHFYMVGGEQPTASVWISSMAILCIDIDNMVTIEWAPYGPGITSKRTTTRWMVQKNLEVAWHGRAEAQSLADAFRGAEGVKIRIIDECGKIGVYDVKANGLAEGLHKLGWPGF